MNEKKNQNRVNKYLANLSFFLAPLLFLSAYLFFNDIKEEPVVEAERETMQYMATAMTFPDPSEEEVTISSESDKEVAKKLVADFLEAFHETDSVEPLGYIDRSAPFMTDNLINLYQNVPRRGTLTEQVITIDHIELTPVDLQADQQIWQAVVTSEVMATDEQSEITYDLYTILLMETGTGWKVGEVKVE